MKSKIHKVESVTLCLFSGLPRFTIQAPTQNVIKWRRLSGKALHWPHFAWNPVTKEGNAKRESALRAQALQIHPACCPVPVIVVVDGAWPSFLKRARSWPWAACECKETAQCNVSLTRKLELKFCFCAAHLRAVQNGRWTYILAACAPHP